MVGKLTVTERNAYLFHAIGRGALDAGSVEVDEGADPLVGGVLKVGFDTVNATHTILERTNIIFEKFRG